MNVGVGVTRLSASGENIDLLKNAPLPQGSALEFMQGNKVVLQAGDCVRVNSDTNTSVDALSQSWRSPDASIYSNYGRWFWSDDWNLSWCSSCLFLVLSRLVVL